MDRTTTGEAVIAASPGRNLLADGPGSVLVHSTAEFKGVSLAPIRPRDVFSRPVSRVSLLSGRLSAGASTRSTSRSWPASRRESRVSEASEVVEVGGCGGIPGGWQRRPTGRDGRNSSAVRSRVRESVSRRGVTPGRPQFTVTCLLRHIPGSARPVSCGRDGDAPISGFETVISKLVVEALNRPIGKLDAWTFFSCKLAREINREKVDMNLLRCPPTVVCQEGDI